jgi:sulfhydrogenase subunit beta (sulfur reductase)
VVAVAEPVVFDVEGLQALIDAAAAQGRTVVGPTLREGAVVHDTITSTADLPRGVHDEQDAGRYRTTTTDDPGFFGFAAGPQSWKPWVFPGRELLRSSGRQPVPSADPPSLLLLGVRSCDLAALGVLDRVLQERPAVDTAYVARRAAVLVVAVTCETPAGTCFCVSTDSGPAPRAGYDLALTELVGGVGEHRFVARTGTDEGERLLAAVASRPATQADLDDERHLVSRSSSHMGRSLQTQGLRDVLHANPDSPVWDDVADRCLSCGNCTLVCPTCFCTSVDDVAPLVGDAQRWRVWDSCFSTDHSYVHGGPVRSGTKARYRQWATHKLASWWDQFGTSGCVGCGRCITWCPVAIDLTEEVGRIQADARDAEV